ncbi:MAG: dicarboxylate/amino acid:cation symporter [Candidatus Zixiibacteriota bacterium]
MPLHQRMAVGLLTGASLGVLSFIFFRDAEALRYAITYVAQPLGQIFLRLLFMLVIPLVFSALTLGVAEIGDPRRLGRVGLKMLAYTAVVSSIAVLLGVFLVNVLRPGEGMSQETRARLLDGAAERAAVITARAPASGKGPDFIVRIIPDNPIKAATDMDMLAVMFFAFMIGVGLILTRSEASRRFATALQGLYDVTMRLIGLVIEFAPIGVGALLFTLTAQLGYEILLQLVRYVGVVLLAMIIHQFGVYSLAVRLLGRMSPRRFFRGIEEAMLTAFSTASSNATLPTSLRVAQDNLKLPSSVGRFVLTIGSTANQNGTALYEGVTVLFLAQFYGVALSLPEQILIVFICILGGIGTAGVPAASLPVVAMILGMVHVPVEGLGLILGVDRFLDMCRTTLNVTGDLAGAVVVSRGETEAGSTLATENGL